MSTGVLLITYALAYFAPGERLRDVDEHCAGAFVDWLCRLTDEDGHRLWIGRCATRCCRCSLVCATPPRAGLLAESHGGR